MSSEFGYKCESEFGYAIESEFGFRGCEGGALYIMTVKPAASELFLYRCDPTTGTVIFKINLWTIVNSPGTLLSTNWGKIEVTSSQSFVFINHPGGMLKINAGLTTLLADRVVWQTAFSGQKSLCLSSDGDPRWGAARYNSLTGAVTWSVFSDAQVGCGFNAQIHWAVRSVSGGVGGSITSFIQERDKDGALVWTTIFDTAFGGSGSNPVITVHGVGTTKDGRTWIAYTSTVAAGIGTSPRYRLKMFNADGTLFASQPFAAGEAPTIIGNSFELNVTPSKTAATWRYMNSIRRTKQITDLNAEVATTDHTAANFPRRFVRGNTGDYSYDTTSGNVGKFAPDLVTIVAGFTPVVLDAGISTLLYLGVTD